MRTKLISLIICLLVATYANSQTEEDTINFLNSKLELYTAPLMGKAFFKVKTTGIKPNKTIIIELHTTSFQHTGYDLSARWQFQTNQIAGIKEVTSSDGSLYLTIVCNQKLTYNLYGELKKDDIIRIALNASNQEVLRIKKAFEHLFKLNGFKDNDNLFKD